jgi:hypothetical protein
MHRFRPNDLAVFLTIHGNRKLTKRFHSLQIKFQLTSHTEASNEQLDNSA